MYNAHNIIQVASLTFFAITYSEVSKKSGKNKDCNFINARKDNVIADDDALN